MNYHEYKPLIDDIKNIKTNLQAEGLFDVDPKFHIKQHILIWAILGSSLYLLHLGSLHDVILGSIALSVFYFQGAYLSHDMAHGQVTRNKQAMDRLYSYMSILQGLSITWWKNKHTIHHQHPNAYKMVDGSLVHVDDDVDTMPFLCWSAKHLHNIDLSKKPFLAAWLKIQRFAVWPLLLLLRLSWIKNGLVTGTPKERVLILAHHIILGALAYYVSGQSSFLVAAWWLGANLIGGFITGSFFLFSHSDAEIYDVKDRGDHYYAQIRSTRNFSNNAFIRWMSGGLNLQLEHHFFPSMPRNRLYLAAVRVEAAYKKHGIQYPMVSLGQAACHIHKALDLQLSHSR